MRIALSSGGVSVRVQSLLGRVMPGIVPGLARHLKPLAEREIPGSFSDFHRAYQLGHLAGGQFQIAAAASLDRPTGLKAHARRVEIGYQGDYQSNRDRGKRQSQPEASAEGQSARKNRDQRDRFIAKKQRLAHEFPQRLAIISPARTRWARCRRDR
jgi:hypothetical protein